MSVCGNCKTKLSCGCQRRKASDGTQVCFTNLTTASTFESAVTTWLTTCQNDCNIELFDCFSTCTAIDFPALPAQCGI